MLAKEQRGKLAENTFWLGLRKKLLIVKVAELRTRDYSNRTVQAQNTVEHKGR